MSIDWSAYPTYDHRRPLRLRNTRMRGKDVYALQTALVSYGIELPSNPDNAHGCDGTFGPATDNAVMAVQTDLEIVVDGIVGPGTYAAFGKYFAQKIEIKYDLAAGLPLGQLSKESSLRFGTYSPRRPNGSYDAGFAQRNTEHTPPEQGFDVDDSSDALGKRVRDYYNLFQGVTDYGIRWMLAAGSWNAPAYACFLANEKGASVPKNQTRDPRKDGWYDRFVEYMEDATAMMTPSPEWK